MGSIAKAWNKMKNKNSSSYDTLGLCNRMINICISPQFRTQITDLLNTFILTNVLPTKLSFAKLYQFLKLKCQNHPMI